ncbi:mercuric reductase [Aggregatilineales bacterium SYSU G02658]
MQRYDSIIIGSGQAGPPLAVGLVDLGQRVALFEGNLLGGSCVNYGCTPTKTLRKSARVAHLVRRAGEFGVHTSPPQVDFAAVMARVNQVVSASRSGLEQWLSRYPDQLDVVREYAQFDGRDGDLFRVRAGDARYAAPTVYLNTGTRASVPPIAGLTDVPYLDNVRLLALEALPEHLIILGGSYIGLEMAQIFRRLGSAVSIIEPAPRLAPREDPDVSAALANLMGQEGVTLYVGHSAVEASAASGTITVTLERGGLRLPVTGSHLLVATGRTPNTDQLNAASVGLKLDERGFVEVDGLLETNVKGIFALGDINQRGAFTHTSYQDHEIALANLNGGSRSVDGRITTYALFTDPPLGRVGLNETEARKSGRRVLMAVHQMANVSRAKEESETVGLIKLLADADSGHLLGATFFGIGGDEIVQIVSHFMAAGGTYQTMKDVLPVHPTVAEFIPTILNRLKPLE